MESTEKQSVTITPNGNGAGRTGAATVGEAKPVVEKTSRAMNPGTRRLLMIGGALVVLALLVWTVKYFVYASAHQTTDDARVDAATISVSSKISERVSQILVETDQRVHRGQLLVQLDDRDERARLSQAQAAVTAQRAQAAAAQSNVALTQQTVSAQGAESLGGVASAQSGISNAQAQVDVAQAGVATAREAVPAALAASKRANADLNRTQSLVATGDLPAAQLDAARANAAAAQAQYQEALANVGAAQARVTAASTQISSAQGSLSSAQGKLGEATAPARIAASQAQANAAYATVSSLLSQLALAKDQVADTRIVSPIDGYIGAKNVEVGQVVGPGVSVLTVIPAQDIFVTANYKETQIGAMRPGQPVDIKIDAYKGVVFHGHVIAINPASQNTYSLVPAQNASGNFIKVTQRIPVKIGFDHPPADLPLRPGMSVETSVKVK
ncbi:MAG: HlyD family secretion protein [Vulcanimicrobiaceae bacterium]